MMDYLPRIVDRDLRRRSTQRKGNAGLLEIKRLIQAHNTVEQQVPLREPDLLVVLTGGSMAYTKEDGVKVIPLACLKD